MWQSFNFSTVHALEHTTHCCFSSFKWPENFPFIDVHQCITKTVFSTWKKMFSGLSTAYKVCTQAQRIKYKSGDDTYMCFVLRKMPYLINLSPREFLRIFKNRFCFLCFTHCCIVKSEHYLVTGRKELLTSQHNTEYFIKVWWVRMQQLMIDGGFTTLNIFALPRGLWQTRDFSLPKSNWFAAISQCFTS